MDRVLVFSYQRTVDYDYADINFYIKLKKKIPADFAAVSIKMKKFQSFECYTKKFQNHNKFKKVNTIWIDSFFQALRVFSKYDILILCGLFGSKIYSDYAKKLGLKVILVDKSFNYDYFISEGVDSVILRNNYGLKRLKKLNKKYKGDVKVLSSIDAGEINLPIFKKQKDKRALVVLTGPQHQDDWYNKKINKIKEILIKNNFKIFYKSHPRSLFKSKNIKKKINNKNKFNSLLKRINLVITIHSNFYQELNYFNYPVIFIDRLIFLSPASIRNKIKVNNFFSKIDIYKFSKDKKIIKKIHRLKPKQDCSRINMYESKIEDNLKFYGCDLPLDYLDKFLKKKQYLKTKTEKMKFKEYKKELINEVGDKGLQKIIMYIKKIIEKWKKKADQVKNPYEKKLILLKLILKKTLIN